MEIEAARKEDASVVPTGFGVYWGSAFPTLKRGANKLCASGARPLEREGGQFAEGFSQGLRPIDFGPYFWQSGMNPRPTRQARIHDEKQLRIPRLPLCLAALGFGVARDDRVNNGQAVGAVAWCSSDLFRNHAVGPFHE